MIKLFDIFVNNYFVFFIFIIIIYFSFLFYIKDDKNKLMINILTFVNIFTFLLFLNESSFLKYLYILNYVCVSVFTLKRIWVLIISNLIFIVLSILGYNLFFAFNVYLILMDGINYLKKPDEICNMRIILYLFMLISLLLDKLYVGNIYFTLFYYIYLICNFYVLDELTNTWNRKPFKRDINKCKKVITGVISIDLNDLKKINDTYGHEAGDKAIVCLVENIRKLETNNMRLYRMGGDEFVILCYSMPNVMIDEFIKSLKDEMNKTKYSCAVGVAYREKDMSLKEMLTFADEEMYKDKKYYKNVRDELGENLI